MKTGSNNSSSASGTKGAEQFEFALYDRRRNQREQPALAGMEEGEVPDEVLARLDLQYAPRIEALRESERIPGEDYKLFVG